MTVSASMQYLLDYNVRVGCEKYEADILTLADHPENAGITENVFWGTLNGKHVKDWSSTEEGRRAMFQKFQIQQICFCFAIITTVAAIILIALAFFTVPLAIALTVAGLAIALSTAAYLGYRYLDNSFQQRGALIAQRCFFEGKVPSVTIPGKQLSDGKIHPPSQSTITNLNHSHGYTFIATREFDKQNIAQRQLCILAILAIFKENYYGEEIKNYISSGHLHGNIGWSGHLQS